MGAVGCHRGVGRDRRRRAAACVGLRWGGGGVGWAAARRPAVACVVRQPVPERGEGVEAKEREGRELAGRGDAPWRSRAQPPRHGGLAADG